MRCKQCNKLLKENTDGNLKYCQGHTHGESIKKDKKKKKAKVIRKYVRKCFLCSEPSIEKVQSYPMCALHLPWATASNKNYPFIFDQLMGNLEAKFKVNS